MGVGQQRPRPLVECRGRHMNDAFRNPFFDQLGLLSLLDQHRRLNRAS